MEGFAFVVLFGLVAGGIAFYQWHRREQRRSELAAFATQYGLSYARHDLQGLVRLPFELFGRGDDQGVENVLSGTLDGEPFLVFDFWYMEESTDSEGRTSRTYHRFTCAVGAVARSPDEPRRFWPHLRIDREGVWGRLKDTMGFRDIQFESDEFNRRFEVQCVDRRFASTVIDPRMMQFLLMTDDLRFEVHRGQILVASKQTTPAGFLTLHHVVSSFRERIPDVAYSLYPD